MQLKIEPDKFTLETPEVTITLTGYEDLKVRRKMKTPPGAPEGHPWHGMARSYGNSPSSREPEAHEPGRLVDLTTALHYMNRSGIVRDEGPFPSFHIAVGVNHVRIFKQGEGDLSKLGTPPPTLVTREVWTEAYKNVPLWTCGPAPSNYIPVLQGNVPSDPPVPAQPQQPRLNLAQVFLEGLLDRLSALRAVDAQALLHVLTRPTNTNVFTRPQALPGYEAPPGTVLDFLNALLSAHGDSEVLRLRTNLDTSGRLIAVSVTVPANEPDRLVSAEEALKHLQQGGIIRDGSPTPLYHQMVGRSGDVRSFKVDEGGFQGPPGLLPAQEWVETFRVRGPLWTVKEVPGLSQRDPRVTDS